MKRGCVLLLILFIVLLAGSVSANELYWRESLVLEQTISNGATIVPLRSNYRVDYFEMHVAISPMDTFRQDVTSRKYSPSPKLTGDEVLYRWDNPRQTTVGFQEKTRVLATATRPEVRSRVPFPLESVPNEVVKYTDFTKSINVNNDIRRTANELATGVDDLYELEFHIAEWVHDNIAYNLSTLTSEVNEPSTWVYENRYGVCDEITNLFISFNRALGIPARFVSGVAYTDTLQSDNMWGNHGWAEVYFPGTGWVPFDIAYHEYGYVDATHIALDKSIDGIGHSVRYSHKGIQDSYEVQTQNIIFDTRNVRNGSIREDDVRIVLSLQEQLIGDGSFNLLKATIENQRDYYVVETLRLARTADVEFDDYEKFVLLKPKETKTVYWLFKLVGDYDAGYIYTYPLGLQTSNGKNYETTFQVKTSAQSFSKTYMEQFMKQEEVFEKTSVYPSCSIPAKVSEGDEPLVRCSFGDSKKSAFPLSICFENECEEILSREEIALFTLPLQGVGLRTVSFTIISQEGTQESFISYHVLDEPSVNISFSHIPKTMTFADIVDMNVSLVRTSFATPQNISLLFDHPLFKGDWSFEDLSEDKFLYVQISGDRLKLGDNKINVSATFYDHKGNEFVRWGVVQTTLVDLSFGQWVSALINTLSAFAEGFLESVVGHVLSEQATIETRRTVSVIAFFIFLFVAGMITRSIGRGVTKIILKSRYERKRK